MTTKPALHAKAIAPKLLFAVVLFTMALPVMSFKNHVAWHRLAVVDRPSAMAEGKAWWITYYITNDKKLYISYAYNNDSYYCSNEIKEAYRKWLILNDHDNTPSSVNITSEYATSKADVEEKWEKRVLKYKGYGYLVIKVDFTYTEK